MLGQSIRSFSSSLWYQFLKISNKLTQVKKTYDSQHFQDTVFTEIKTTSRYSSHMLLVQGSNSTPSLSPMNSHLDIVDDKLLEAVWQRVLCLLVASITHIGHSQLSLETTTDSVVNTLGPPPVCLQKQQKKK